MESKVIDSGTLFALNRKAVKENRNRAFEPEWLRTHVDPSGVHVVSRVLLHNDVEWRCQVYVKVEKSMDAVVGWLDVSLADWRMVEKVDERIKAAFASEEEN